MSLQEFLDAARATFGPTVRRIDPARSNMHPWVPMRFYTPPKVQRAAASKKRR